MTGPDPAEFGWWLASRAAGVVALLCISVSVGAGLAMAGRVSRRPALARTLLSVHQQTALVGLVAIASAGIGATPVLAMLHALAADGSRREVWWIHGARNGREHAFRAEVHQLVAELPNGHMHVRYSRPDRRDVVGRDYDAEGRLGAEDLLHLGIPLDAEFRLCGPHRFVADLEAGLREAGVQSAKVRSESFGGAPAPRPSAPAPAASPAQGSHPTVAFSRSGVTATWDTACATLLELAEANAVPAASGCRIGACHGCRARVLAGSVRHDPEPLEPPPPGSALLCCAVPDGDVVLDA